MKTATMRFRWACKGYQPPKLQQLWVQLPDWVDSPHHLAELMSDDDETRFSSFEWRDVSYVSVE